MELLSDIMVHDAVLLYDDSYYVKGFAQRYMNVDPEAALKALLETAPWTDPAHPDFRYRGHELPRQKAFWNRADATASIYSPPDPLYRYNYPGFQ